MLLGGLSGVMVGGLCGVPPRIVSGLRCRPPGWRGLCRPEGVVPPADPGTPQCGTWPAARVEFVGLALSKPAACQAAPLHPDPSRPPAQRQTPAPGKQSDAGALRGVAPLISAVSPPGGLAGRVDPSLESLACPAQSSGLWPKLRKQNLGNARVCWPSLLGNC